MSDFWAILSTIGLGYLIGSLPFSVWVAKLHQVNIFEVGSGNPGATNVKREVSKFAGNLVFFLDFVKGVIAVYIAMILYPDNLNTFAIGCFGLLGALIGHGYSFLIGFRGGKGVATSMGGLLMLVPVVLLTGIALWIILFYSTRYVSIASIGFGISLPVTGMIQLQIFPESKLSAYSILVLLFLSLVILIRHRTNIQRLLNGTENKFNKSRV